MRPFLWWFLAIIFLLANNWVLTSAIDNFADDFQNFKVYVVYMMHIHPANNQWRSIVSGQLASLHDSKLISMGAEFHVEISIAPSESMNAVVDAAIKFVEKYAPTSNIAITYKNEYEYQGINRVWQIGKSIAEYDAPNSLILYFHTKCMVYQVFSPLLEDGRCLNDKSMVKYVITPWRNVTALFRANSNLNKAGLGLAPQGFVWGNFFWARASYVKTLEHPLIADDRFYYERWLGYVAPQMGERNSAADGLTLCPPGEKMGTVYQNGGEGRHNQIPCWDGDPFPGHNPYLAEK